MFGKSFATFNDESLKQYRQHTVFGYLMLSQNPAIPSTSSAVALQHHEREDGSGYPQGLRGDNRPPLKDISRKNVIHRFAEIVAVADVYDSLISGRHIEDIPPCPPRDAIRKIIQMSGTTLNSEIVKVLVSIIPLFPVGARIRVTNAPSPQLNGYYGVVAKDNHDNLECPLIILYETKNHVKIKPVLTTHRNTVALLWSWYLTRNVSVPKLRCFLLWDFHSTRDLGCFLFWIFTVPHASLIITSDIISRDC
jgi:hypothetical protein